jgi:transcriptional regulator with XRE-family HTH domain
MTTPDDVISANVRARRAYLRLSQAELAEKLGDGWSASAVSRLEAGKRPVKVSELIALATALASTPVELMVEPFGVSDA